VAAAAELPKSPTFERALRSVFPAAAAAAAAAAAVEAAAGAEVEAAEETAELS
jgi:hypothetical protein